MVFPSRPPRQTTTGTMKDRIQGPTSCIQKRRKRRDPPDPNMSSSHNKGMSSADFNYLSLPSLFGSRPVSSRFESSMNDCMLESGAYVSYIAEAMDPAPKLDPEGAVGSPTNKTTQDEEVDFVDEEENTVTDKSDAAFMQAYLRKIEAGETIRQLPERLESMSLHEEGIYVNQQGQKAIHEPGTQHEGGGPMACTPVSTTKTPKATSNLLSTNRLCFGGDPGSPLSTTSGGGASVPPSDSDDSIEGPQQLDCKIKDSQFPVSPARRNSRRLQSPRRTRSRSKSKTPRSSRQTSRRKTRKTSTQSINFTSTIESGSLKSMGSLQEDEPGEHIEVIFVEEQFRKKDSFQYGDKDGAVFSALHQQHTQEQRQPGDLAQSPPQRRNDNDMKMTTPRLKSLRNKSIMDITRGTTTEEESTIRMDERDSMDPRRLASPQQSRQPASPLIEQVEKNPMRESHTLKRASSKESKILLEYSHSETSEQQAPPLDSQASGRDASMKGHSRRRSKPIPENRELETSHSMPSDENRLLPGNSQEHAPDPKKTFSFALTSDTDEPLQAFSSSTSASILETSKSPDKMTRRNSSCLLQTADDANPANIGKSSAEGTSTSNEFVAQKANTDHDQKRAFEASTPLAANLKSDMLELDVSRSHEVLESDFAKEQVSRDMFSIKSDCKSRTSRNDPMTTARVKSLMALVDCASPLGSGAEGRPHGSSSDTQKRFPAFFVPFNPNEHDKEKERRNHMSGDSSKEFSSFFVPFDSHDTTPDKSKNRGTHELKKVFSKKPRRHPDCNSAVEEGRDQCTTGSPAAEVPSTTDSRGPAIEALVEKHGLLQTLHKKTVKTPMQSDFSATNSILADASSKVCPKTNVVDGNRLNDNAHYAESRRSLLCGDSEGRIETTNSALAVCESVPSSIQTQQTGQESMGSETFKSESEYAICNSLPSSIPSEKSTQEPTWIEALSSRPTPSGRCGRAVSSSQTDPHYQESFETGPVRADQSGGDSPAEGYFTCRDKDDSSELESSNDSEMSRRSMHSHQSKHLAEASDIKRSLSKRGQVVSPLTVEKSSTSKEGSSEVARLTNPPQIIEINPGNETSSVANYAPLGMLPLQPSESSRSQFDSIPNTIGDHPCNSGWDISTIPPHSHTSVHGKVDRNVCKTSNGIVKHRPLGSLERTIPHEICTSDVLSVSVGTIQSCVTTSSKYNGPKRDLLGKYSQGRKFSQMTYVRQTHSASVSVTSRRQKKPSESRNDAITNNSNASREDKSDGLSHLRSALPSERSQIMEQVSALMPSRTCEGIESDLERTVKSVFNDSGVVLYQPTINLYGTGRLSHGLEPEGVTKYSSSSGPKITNLTEAEEGQRNDARRDVGIRVAKGHDKEKTKVGTKAKMDPEAISSSEYRQLFEQNELSSLGEKVQVLILTSPLTSSDENGEPREDKIESQSNSQSATIPHTKLPITDDAIRTTDQKFVSCVSQNLLSVDASGLPGQVGVHQIIDCTSDVYDLPDIFHEQELRTEHILEEDRGCLSQGSLNKALSESSRQRLQNLSGPSSTEERDPEPRPKKRQTEVQDGHNKDIDGLLQSIGATVSDLSGWMPVKSAESSDSHGVRPNHRNERGMECHELRERLRGVDCHELRERLRGSCQACTKGDVVNKMGDLCVKAGIGMSDALRQSLSKRNLYNKSHSKRVIREDDDDGMEAELRDLERSEQLLRKELELVHQQAEIRRQRLHITKGNEASAAVDPFSECLWPSNTDGPASTRLIGRRLVVSSFSTSQKSVDDDLTENYFSPTEDYSLSPQTSLEQSLHGIRSQDSIPANKQTENPGGDSTSSEELEVIFVEDSFLSTESFSFGDLTKTSDDLLYLRKSQCNASGPDPVGEARTWLFKSDPSNQPDGLETNSAAKKRSGTKSDPVEIISLLSVDQNSPETEPAQPGDPGMPILIESEDETCLKMAAPTSRCDPPGSSPEVAAQELEDFSSDVNIANEASEASTYLKTMNKDQGSTAAEHQYKEPLESIEVIVLENGKLPACVDTDSNPIATPDSVGKKSTVRKDSVSNETATKVETDPAETVHPDPQKQGPQSHHAILESKRSCNHHRMNHSVTFSLPEMDKHRQEGETCRIVSTNSTTNSGNSRESEEDLDVIDLRNFDESVLESRLLSSNLHESENHANAGAPTPSIGREFRSPSFGLPVMASTPGGDAKMITGYRTMDTGSNSSENGISQPVSGDRGSRKRLETIDIFGQSDEVTFLGERPELPLPPAAGPYNGSYGASTFEDTKDSDTCESLSSRVKRLIAKAKSNRRDAGHDTFESRSTLTIKIPESLSLLEEEQPAPQLVLRQLESEQNLHQDFERTIEDNITPEFSTVTNRIPARVMLARPSSHDQTSLSTITLPQLHEGRARSFRNRRTEEKEKRRAYPDLMAFVKPSRGESTSHDKGGMEIHVSRADDESSVTMDFPASLSPLKEQNMSSTRGREAKRPTSPSRIQRLINSGKKFISATKLSPRNKSRVNQDTHQSVANLESALGDTWSLEAANTHRSLGVDSDSLAFTYSLSPIDSSEKESPKPQSGAQLESKKHQTLVSRRDRVRKLHRTLFSKNPTAPQSPASEPTTTVVQNDDDTKDMPTQTRPEKKDLSFEETYDAMKQRVQEMRHLSQSESTTYSDIFRGSPTRAVHGSPNQMADKHQLRPPRPPQNT